MKISYINGPNLNLLGKRRPDIYGRETLTQVEEYIRSSVEKLFPECELSFFRSNSEGGIIDRIHALAESGVDALIINAGAYTHYSYAIRDALEAADDMGMPAWEVHLSDVNAREKFRQISVIREVCKGCVFGIGKKGYVEATRLAVEYLKNKTKETKK